MQNLCSRDLVVVGVGSRKIEVNVSQRGRIGIHEVNERVAKWKSDSLANCEKKRDGERGGKGWGGIAKINPSHSL